MKKNCASITWTLQYVTQQQISYKLHISIKLQAFISAFYSIQLYPISYLFIYQYESAHHQLSSTTINDAKIFVAIPVNQHHIIGEGGRSLYTSSLNMKYSFFLIQQKSVRSSVQLNHAVFVMNYYYNFCSISVCALKQL